MPNESFKDKFAELTGHPPFPWQKTLYYRFIGEAEGGIPEVASIPTGLGKTSVIAVWLIALAEQIRNSRVTLPRRLVYVVNRRTVVDQTTTEALRLRDNAKSIGIKHLALSTLRGQLADNREWSADPSCPAVICGTVDMIGSRLLFSGYRIGFKSRPLHAGFLGQDALLVHDETHLEPAFQQLIDTIQCEQKKERERNGDLPWPGLRVMALSATTRTDSGNAGSWLALESEDHEHQEIQKRINAAKTLYMHPCPDEKKQLVDQIVERALAHQESGCTVLVFTRRVDDALTVLSQLEKKHPRQVAPLTGTMRGYERDRLVRNNPVFARFMPESDRSDDVTPAEGTVYLVCTSAGEVGVNLSADHMVCDLSTFDSMAQRLGRVNRFGERDDTRIDVVHPTEFDDKKPNPQRKATVNLLRKLNDDASPKSLSDLMDALSEEDRGKAFAPPPTIPQATDILFDAWAVTTIRGDMPGRPPVAPYLHGIAEWEPQRTTVAWREEVAVIGRDLIERHGEQFPQVLLDDYPLKPHELLADTTDRVHKALTALMKRAEQDFTTWIISDTGEVVVEQLGNILDGEKKQVIERLAECTILLPPDVGGLANGMLDGKAKKADDVADEWYEKEKQRRIRLRDEQTPPPGMALIRTVDTRPDDEEFTPPELEDESGDEEQSDKSSSRPRFWHWYVRPADAENATSPSLRPVTWKNHTDDVVRHATQIVAALDLPKEMQQAVIHAAELHDLGKQRELWQRSIGNPNPTDWYAKPGKPEGERRWRPRQISDYRHEFGSLLDVLDPAQRHHRLLEALSPDIRDVVFHLISTHHGYARPHFPPERAIDPNHPQAIADEVLIEAMRRYARLQRRYGRWGLAYLESLLRAADWAASANPSVTESLQETSA